MKIHFIAIGGSAMHNLAIALHKKGYQISGSDDEIFDPAKSRLEKYGLLPKTIGWDSNRIDASFDAIILGMHARADNPELLKAKELGITIYSYPEFLYQQSKDKTRIVVGGSHGKTTITAMIIHVLQQLHIDCDYMVGAQLEGFEVMVKLTDEASIMIIEGDEYLTSPIDLRPKFHLYHPTIGIISGIAWDHINVFPTFEEYVKQFEIFAQMIPKNGRFIYYEDDIEIQKISKKIPFHNKFPYTTHPYHIKEGKTYLETPDGEISIHFFGKHNLTNMNAAKLACNAVGVADCDFYHAIATFKGASKRLELIAQTDTCSIYKDFAHAPSKLKATIDATREMFPQRKLIACIELHTFSSLNQQFLAQYQHTMEKADIAIVFYNPATVQHKKLPPITDEMIENAFQQKGLLIFHNASELRQKLLAIEKENSVFLLMSSGNFGGMNIEKIAEEIMTN